MGQGSLRVASRRQDRYGKYAIPVYRGQVGKTTQGVAEAVNAAAGGTIKKFVREKPPKAGKRRKLKAGSNKFRQVFTRKGGVESMDESADSTDDDEPKKRKHKRKRSRIDDVLGDDSY